MKNLDLSWKNFKNLDPSYKENLDPLYKIPKI